jgi:hypothetical protein
MEDIKKFGKCFECGRLMKIERLRQIQFFDFHLTDGDYHHKLVCDSCITKAEEI